jgi:hypothetical protein
MSDDASSPDPTVTEAAATAAAPETPATARKKKYSRGLRGAQEMERAASKATHRMARAVEKGLAAYREERDRSAGKRRDGALRDFADNVAHGTSKALREASRVPADLAKALDARPLRKMMRRGMLLMAFPFSR